MIAADRNDRADFLAGTGEMGERIRGFDWTRTPLGPIESWPPSLRTSISLILNSRHPMWIGWGPEMPFLYNDAYLPVLGPAKHPWALGRPASEVWAEIWDICWPLARKVFEHGESSFFDDVRLFMNRGEFLEETFYSFSYSPIRDDSGRVCGLFCPSTDVTPKVLSARRLSTLSALAGNALVERTVVAACQAVKRILEKNPDDVPFALLYLADSQGRKAFLEQTVGAFAPGFEEERSVDLEERCGETASNRWPIAEVFRTGQKQTIPVRRLSGVPLGVAEQMIRQAVVLPVTSRAGRQPHGVLVAGVSPGRPLDADQITFFELLASQAATAIENARVIEEERKRADTLAELDRAKTVFFSNVSHEFRTPLTLMLGPLENLLSKPEHLGAQDREQLDIAHRNSLRLLRLVNSLLDFSRLEAGRLKASFTATDLAEYTKDLAANFRSALQAAGLEFIVECEALPEPVYVDPEMWERIVLNLLSNAFKFTFEGQIRIRLEAKQGQAVLTVADTGIGIPEHELPRIFERFHRVEGARGRTYEGTGIGLALIHEYVKLHGGGITAASRTGEGSTFTVTLPLGASHLPEERIDRGGARTAVPRRAREFTDEAVTWLPNEVDGPAAGSAEATSAGELRRGSRPRVLLADDNADMREHVRRILGDAYEITVAKDGREALEQIRREPPDLLLSDVMMPELNGIELLREVRGNPRTQTLPVIFLSARAGEEMQVEGLDAGADDYLVKPFTASELRARVGAHVQMALARRRAMEREAELRAEAEAARDQAVAILESITDGFIALDRDWRITYVNGEAERLNGMRREAMIGRSNWEVFPDAVGTPLEREFRRAAEQGVAVDFENYYAPWQRWFHIKVYPASDGGLSVFFEDVTAEKRAQEALRESERASRLLAAIVDSSEDAIISKDLNSVVTSWNRAAERLFGYTAAEAIGRSIMMLIPEERSGEEAGILDRIRRGKSVEHFETVRKRKDGVLRDISLTISPVRDASGQIVGASKIARDITDQKRAEAALRESEARFRQLADAMPQMVWTARADGQMDYYNQRWYQFTGDDASGEGSFESALHPEDAKRWLDTWSTAVQTGEPYRIEYRFRDRQEKRWRWFMGRALPVRDESGAVVKWIGSCTDIDDQKRVEDDLRRANQDLEQFAYSASHDLQEPLRSIKIYGELLTKRYGARLDGQAFEFLDYLRSGATRMEILVRDLLMYTQLTRLDMPVEATNAGEALSTTLASLGRAIAESHASVTSDPLPSVNVNGTHLRQLFQNLIGNAIKYRNPDRTPAIHVGCELRNGSWIFSVRDNGIGIEPQYKEHIFGLFKRLHTGDEYSGTGIGLAICQRIVERYRGRIWVESEAGNGSAFFFSLPV